MKTYVITLSQQFPKGHRRHGEPTYFREQFQNTILDDAGVSACDCCKYETRDCEVCGYKAVNFRKKIHTIRANYPLWEHALPKSNAVMRVFPSVNGRGCLTAVNR